MSNGSHNLLIEVAKTVEVFGDEGTANILRTERIKNISTRHIDFIINMVCERFEFKNSEVVDSNSKNTKRICALQFICYYSSQYLTKISNEEIGNRIKRHESLIRKYHTLLTEKKKDKAKTNQYYQSHFKYFDEEIKKYISENPSVAAAMNPKGKSKGVK